MFIESWLSFVDRYLSFIYTRSVIYTRFVNYWHYYRRIIRNIYARTYHVNDVYYLRMFVKLYYWSTGSSRCTVPKNLVGDTERLKSAFIQWCVRTMSIPAPLSFVTYLTETFHLSTSISWWENTRVSALIRSGYQHIRRFMIAIPQDKSWARWDTSQI